MRFSCDEKRFPFEPGGKTNAQTGWKLRMQPDLSNKTDLINGHLPPSATLALERRIKRHITGRDQVFFAVTAPGLESICRDELLGIGIAEEKMQAVPGGVEFTGRMHDCYRSNLHSRIATRILMRIAEFKATGFGELEKKTAKVPWELFLYPGCSIGITVSTQKSRLLHTAAIAERIHQILAAHLGSQREAPPILGQRIFVRVLSDRFTLSIDSSGAPLYKRGVKTHGGKAPLRETAAAAILALAGYLPGGPLIDPMCGSGTFSIEAAMMARNLPPGWFRDFAFAGWPSFRPRQWAHLREEAKSRFVQTRRPCILACDKDIDTCRTLVTCLETFDLSPEARVECRDFLYPEGIAFSPETPGVIVMNPPFGRRLGTASQSAALILAICNRLKSSFAGWRFALLVPNPGIAKKLPFPCASRPFHHGGLKLTLLTGVVS
jgi:putative N6-adenine-specific DNA methylase